jgi:hypothetical protein
MDAQQSKQRGAATKLELLHWWKQFVPEIVHVTRIRVVAKMNFRREQTIPVVVGESIATGTTARKSRTIGSTRTVAIAPIAHTTGRVGNGADARKGGVKGPEGMGSN